MPSGPGSSGESLLSGDGGDSAVRSLVLLAAPGDSTRIIYHALAAAFGDVVVIQEDPVSRWTFVRNRVRRLGYRTVIGQLLFVLVGVTALTWLGRRRMRSILQGASLDTSPIDERRLVRVASVNSEECRQALRRLDPSVVVVNGTRIIGKSTLHCVQAPFLNMHAGITPRYRGVHGGYWALFEGRPDLVGTTVHVVDEGIDTGSVLGQATFSPEPGDSFVTYPYLHLIAGLPLLLDAVREVLDGREPPSVASLAGDDVSRLWSHPTLWGYVGARLRKSVA